MYSDSSNKSSALMIVAFVLCFAIGLFTGGFWQHFLAYASVFLLGAWIIRLALTTDFLRDDAIVDSGEKKPFSFSRVQLTFWSFLVIGGYIIIFVIHGVYADDGSANILNETSIILLGIGGATTTAASIIDSSDKNATTSDQSIARRHQNTGSDGFFSDILSDADGISIHRLQAMVFNLVYGVILVYSVLKKEEMPEFAPNEQILLGLSAGTYTILKVNENKQSKP